MPISKLPPIPIAIYLAGSMPSDPHGKPGDLASWREGIKRRWEKDWLPQWTQKTVWLCPEFVGKHGGDAYGPTVEEDFTMIDGASLMFAFVDSIERQGTLVEIGYARGKSKGVVALFHHALLSENGIDSFAMGVCHTFRTYVDFDHHAEELACALIAEFVAEKQLCEHMVGLSLFAKASAVYEYERELWRSRAENVINDHRNT